MARKTEHKKAAAEAAARLKDAGLDRLTVEDVIKALEHDGIRDLKQLVRRQLEQAKSTRSTLRHVDLLGPSAKPSPTAKRNIVYHQPEVPVLIDGVLYDPKDIHRFNGRILHFVAPPPTRPILHAFTGDQWPQALRTYLQVRNASSILDLVEWKQPGYQGPAGHGGVLLPQSPGPVSDPDGGPGVKPNPAQFFSNVNYQGDSLLLPRHQAWMDLTKVSRGGFFTGNWNDTISSLYPDTGGGLVVLCRDINLNGPTLTVPEYFRPAYPADVPGAQPDLTRWGWNDLASSLVNW